MDQNSNKFNLFKVVNKIGKMGFNNVLLESGPELNSSFLINNLINKIYYFKSKKNIKSREISLKKRLNIKNIENLNFHLLSYKNIDNDFMKVYEK